MKQCNSQPLKEWMKTSLFCKITELFLPHRSTFSEVSTNIKRNQSLKYISLFLISSFLFTHTSLQTTQANVGCVSTSATSGSYTFIAFKTFSETMGDSESTDPCILSIPAGLQSVDYLLVAGGGGGGYPHAGGGGAGGFLSGDAFDVSALENLYISIGLGGEGTKGSTGAAAGKHGGNTTFGASPDVSDPNTVTATGGGGGDSYNVQRGSGGGVFGNNSVGRGIAGQGNNGGKGTNGFLTDGSRKYVYVAGGGGGAGSVGGSSPTYNNTRGNFPAGVGGDGRFWKSELTQTIGNSLGISSNLISSGNYFFAGGGGGGNASADYYFPSTSRTPAAGGKGGGGTGGLNTVSASATNGVAGSGGGGGGGYVRSNVKNSGDGGSGIAIFRYLTPSNLEFASASTPQVVGNLTYRTVSNLSLIASVAGKVTFRVKGKVIPGCKNKRVNSTNEYTANCRFKPSKRGSISVVATLVPTEANDVGSFSIAETFFVQRRTAPRSQT